MALVGVVVGEIVGAAVLVCLLGVCICYMRRARTHRLDKAVDLPNIFVVFDTHELTELCIHARAHTCAHCPQDHIACNRARIAGIVRFSPCSYCMDSKGRSRRGRGSLRISGEPMATTKERGTLLELRLLNEHRRTSADKLPSVSPLHGADFRETLSDNDPFLTIFTWRQEIEHENEKQGRIFMLARLIWQRLNEF